MLDDVSQQDDRLISVQDQMMRLASEINDAEWEGRDTSHLKERFKILNTKFMEGVVYEPNF
jgi:hypothetical protein